MELAVILRLTLLITQYILTASIIIKPYEYGLDNKKLLCPAVCNTMACGMGILTCSESGLTQLPITPPPNTTKVLMINLDFSHSSTLSKHNFTEYNVPAHNITKITIQNCSLMKIETETFARLTYLETLDLSFNKLKEIAIKTFAGLTLQFLRLDGNVDVKLTYLSFQDLRVVSLSLMNCHLTDLSFAIFEPISHSLVRLMLSRNRLKTLESRFDVLFQQLDLIGLEENQFDCGQCSVFWLIGSMKSKLRKHPDSQKMLFPRCNLPLRLKERFMHDLSAEDVECPKPSVHIISILILPNNSAALTCTASDVQSQVVWTQVVLTNRTKPHSTGDILLSEAVHSNNFLVVQQQPIDVFSCTVTSPLGNRSSTRLQISWPKRRTTFTDKIDTPSTTPKRKDHTSKSYLFQPQFSLIEMIAGVIGTFIGTLLLFVAMLRCIFYRMKFCTKTSQLREHQLSISSSKKGKMKQYVTYETPLYSDGTIYDVATLSPKINKSEQGHFIDFKNQQAL